MCVCALWNICSSHALAKRTSKIMKNVQNNEIMLNIRMGSCTRGCSKHTLPYVK